MKQGFTLIEILIVIVIIAILAAITSRFNRSQIGETSAMNERESRIMRHDKYNDIATNTNYINNKKVENMEFHYHASGVDLFYSGGSDHFYFTHNTFSGVEFMIIKQTLELGCTIDTESPTFELTYGAGKSKNFTLDTTLCRWK